jgi:hypothetical protein
MSQLSDVTAKQECEKLMNNLLPTAQSMLSEYREFYPYGGYIELDGQIRHVGVKDETTEYPQSEDMIDVLEKLFLEKVRQHGDNRHQAGTASYTYDILGRLATETRTLTGANNAAIPKNLSYEYNLDGSLYKLHYPSGNVVTYTPDSAGRALSAVDNGSGINYITGATYGPDGGITGFVSGNSGTSAGITNAFSYNKRLQPVNMSATFGSPVQTVFSINYDFHAGNGTAGSGADNGNVFGITNYKDQNRNQTFTYDALNRLISAQNAGTNCAATVIGGKSEYWGNSYGYDAWGNLLQKSVTKCGAENLIVT